MQILELYTDTSRYHWSNPDIYLNPPQIVSEYLMPSTELNKRFNYILEHCEQNALFRIK